MFKRKKLIILVLAGIVVLALIGLIWLFFFWYQPNNLYRTYSLADFPQVDKKQNNQPTIDRLNKDVQALRSGQTGNYEPYDYWNDIGIRKQALSDYRGAEAAWQQAIDINQNNPLAIANLANLYKAFLPDYARSEGLYIKAINSNINAEPYFPDYEALADLYVNYLTDKKDKVEELMLNGAENAYAPTNKARFYAYLAVFYRDSDQTKFEKYKTLAEKADANTANQLIK